MSRFPIVCVLSLLMGLSACGGDKTPPAPKVVAAPAVASSPDLPGQPALTAAERAEIAAIEAKIKLLHPDLAAARHYVSRVPGATAAGQPLYEIITAEGVVYTDANVRWFLAGGLSLGRGKSPDGQPNVSEYSRRPAMQMLMSSLSGETATPEPSPPIPGVEQSVEDLSGRQLFDSLPVAAGFSRKFGNGSRRLVVFEDPDCIHCQKFHQDLHAAEISGKLEGLDLELITFPYILQDVHPQALSRARAIACSISPSQTWSKWMLAAGQAPLDDKGNRDLNKLWDVWAPINAPGAGDCARAALVDAWQQAGRQMKFVATPTFLFADGTTYEGRLSPYDLDEMVGLAAQHRATQSSLPGPLGSASSLSSQAAAALRDLTSATVKEGLTESEKSKPAPVPGK